MLVEKSQVLAAAFGKETFWYDIYAEQRKIGFASTTYEKAGDEIIIKHKREIKVKKDGHEKLLMEMLKCLSDSYYSIKSFEYASHFKDEEGIKVTGEVDSGNILFFLESPEKRKTYKISTNGKNVLPSRNTYTCAASEQTGAKYGFSNPHARPYQIID